MANLSNINNRFLVTTGGNVLIGNTAASGSALLQVTGNSDFTGSIAVTGTYSDSSGDVGTAGQILSSTATGTNWISHSTANDFLTGLSFNTGDGVLTATVSNQSNVTVDLDGRYLTSETDTLQNVCSRGNSTSTAINMTGSGASGYLYVAGNAASAAPTNSQGMAFAYNNSGGSRENELFFNPGIVTPADNATYYFAIINEYLNSSSGNARTTDTLFKLYGDGNLELVGPTSTSTIANTHWRMPKVAAPNTGYYLSKSAGSIDLQWTAPPSGGSGTVTSVATGNGLTGGTITTTGTLTMSGSYSGTFTATSLASDSFLNNAGSLLFSSGVTTGTPRSLNLRTTNATSDPSSSDQGDSTGITWGQRTDSNPYYIIYPKLENYNGSGNYSKLTIAWHTGIKIGANDGYGGTRFYDDSPDISGAAVIMSVGVGNTDIDIANGLTIGGSSQGRLSAGNVDRNLKYTGGSSSDAGFTGFASNGGHLWQLYGSGNDYGFLDGNWAAWDLQKTKNGNLYMNGSTTYYVNTTSNSFLAGNLSVGLVNTSYGIFCSSAISGTNMYANSSGGSFVFGASTSEGEYIQRPGGSDDIVIVAGSNERLRIKGNGALAVNGSSNYGTAGQVLTSNGNAAPSWQAGGGGGLTPALVEQTWTFTRAELNAGFGGSGYTLIAAPGGGTTGPGATFVVIEESYWMTTGTATSNSSLQLEARQSNQIPGVQTVTRVNGTQWNYMTNHNSGNGMVYRPAVTGNAVVRTYLPGTATTLHKVSGSTLPTGFTNLKLKIIYKLFTSANI